MLYLTFLFPGARGCSSLLLCVIRFVCTLSRVYLCVCVCVCVCVFVWDLTLCDVPLKWISMRLATEPDQARSQERTSARHTSWAEWLATLFCVLQALSLLVFASGLYVDPWATQGRHWPQSL
jgi:hypothetical protein